MRNTKNGVAWYGCDYGVGQKVRYSHSMLARLGAVAYYNDVSFQQVSNGFAMPMIRLHQTIQPGNLRWWQNVCSTLGEHYSGPALVLNEPERLDQDNVAFTTGRWFSRQVRLKLPRAHFIWPNVVVNEAGLRWLHKFLVTRKVAQPYAWGVHVYESSGTDAQAILQRVADVVERHGYDCDRIWITELGYAHNRPETRQVMRNWLDVFRADPRVERIFAYTAHGAQVKTLDMMQADGRLWPTGEEFVR